MSPCSECDKLRAEVERLKENLAWHKEELGLSLDHEVVATLARHFRLVWGDAQFLALLYRVQGRTLSYWQIAESFENSRSEDPARVQAVRACRARRAMGSRDVLWTVRGRGFAMSPAGRALCDAALATQGPTTSQVDTTTTRETL